MSRNFCRSSSNAWTVPLPILHTSVITTMFIHPHPHPRPHTPSPLAHYTHLVLAPALAAHSVKGVRLLLPQLRDLVSQLGLLRVQ